MKKVLSIALAALIAAFAFNSCQPEEKAISVKPATGITLEPTTLSIVHHEVATLKATVTPKDASQQVIWKVTDWVLPATDIKKDEAPVTVSKFGIVEGFKPGTATITATSADGKQSATCTVTVTPAPVESVSLDVTSKEIIEEDSFTLVATVNPKKATDQSVTWTTSNDEVATVDQTGKVTGKMMGTAIITVTTTDGGKTATCEVTVKVRVPDKVEVVEIWKKDGPGGRAILGDNTDKTEAFLTYSAANKAVTWEANTTGKPRTATIEFSNGSKLTVTQVEPKDFAGSWKFTGKTFANNKGLGVSANNSFVANLTIAAAEGTSAKDGSKELTNNLTVSGLINTYVAEACVDIDYDSRSYRFGFFFNGKKAQAVNTGKEGYGYIALLPELGNGWGSYNFCPFPFNDGTNYGWLWMVADSSDEGIDFTTSHYGKQNWLKCDGKDILGLSFCACKSATPAATDFQAANTTTYDVIYQCNVNTADNPGFELKRD